MNPTPRLFPLLLCLLTFSFGEILVKKNLIVTAALRYDDNLLLPDSITGQSSWLPEASFKPALLLQFNPETMIRFSGGYTVQRYLALEQNVHAFDGQVRFRHYHSHRTMTGFSFRYDGDYSENALLENRDMAANLVWGRYLSPLTELQINGNAEQKEYPGLYKSYAEDNGSRSRYYDYREAALDASLNREWRPSFSTRALAGCATRYYFNDHHLFDWVLLRETDSINYIDISSMDTVYYEDTLYGPNVVQSDLTPFAELDATWLPGKAWSATATLYGKRIYSNDPYYNTRHLTATLQCRWTRNALMARASYGFQTETFPDRTDAEAGESALEYSHYTGLTLQYRFNKRISLEASWLYRNYQSYIEALCYDKQVISTLGTFSY